MREPAVCLVQPGATSSGADPDQSFATVRSLRSYLQYTVLNSERIIQEVRPETLFDLNLVANVPANSFLVIAPASGKSWPTSLGDTFFRLNGRAEQYEQVLVLVPRPGERVRALPQ